MITLERLQQVKVMIKQQMFTRLSVFQKYYRLIATDLDKQQKLDADPKAIQQINFTENLNRAEGVTVFFVIEKPKETVLNFLKGTVKVLSF